MAFPAELAQQAAEQLQGSSKSLSDLGERFEAMESNTEFCAVLDSLVFCCNVCDNWFEQSEMAQNHDWICESCAE